VSAKRFLQIFFGVAFAVWLGGSWLLGPPGLSSGFLEEDNNKDRYDRYIKITKDTAYKLYTQRPELHGPGTEDAPEGLAEDIAFVEEFEAEPAYQAEQRRINRYYYFFEIFNAALVLVLILRFATKPLLTFIDEKITELREKLKAAAQARKDAEARREAAQAKMDGLPEEEKQIGAESEVRLKREIAEAEENHRRNLAVMAQEKEDRKREEEHAAAQRLKAELVNLAIDRLADEYQRQRTQENEAALVDRFAGEVEKLA
jgi:F0F1-type ATP synthase membrane subunit b/b'